MRALRNFLVRLFLLITVIGILFGVVFGLTPMANADMQPAVCAGDLMLYYRLDKNLKSDDVVVFQKESIPDGSWQCPEMLWRSRMSQI